MNIHEQFRIESLEELEEAYKHFEDEWDEDFSLESERIYFIRFGYRFITHNDSGINLFKEVSYFKQIPNPLKQKQMKEFTISGSPALKKAFCEEAGLKIEPDSICLGYNGRFHPYFDGVYFSPSIIESNNHFHLPDNYQEALEFVEKNVKCAEIEKETYSIGDVFKDTTEYENNLYLLSAVNNGKFCGLKVQLTRIDDGRPCFYAASVDNPYEITADEMEKITGGDFDDFEKVEHKIK